MKPTKWIEIYYKYKICILATMTWGIALNNAIAAPLLLETSKIYCEKSLGIERSIQTLKRLERSLRDDAAKKTADQLATIRTALENGDEIEIGIGQFVTKNKYRGRVERIEVVEWRDMRPREDVRVTISGKTFSLSINPPEIVKVIQKDDSNNSSLKK